MGKTIPWNCCRRRRRQLSNQGVCLPVLISADALLARSPTENHAPSLGTDEDLPPNRSNNRYQKHLSPSRATPRSSRLSRSCCRIRRRAPSRQEVSFEKRSATAERRLPYP